MELGSKTHKNLLLKGIIKSAFKTTLVGLVIGLLLILPSFMRENLFSIGLAYLGDAIILLSAIYAMAIAYQKHQKIIKPFDKTYK